MGSMDFRHIRTFSLMCALPLTVSTAYLCAQNPPQPESSSSHSSKHTKKPASAEQSALDAGAITNGVYRNKTLAMSCQIPAGWVLRTDEFNAREDDENEPANPPAQNPSSQNPAEAKQPASSAGAKVLLAAFSRPPEARGEDVNSSILIAAESAAAYPGLKEAAQYFQPLTEVAKAQGFTVDEEPYEIELGTKVLVRSDFHKDVGTRIMRQSTLAFLSHGYAVSITVIGGTADEVEELLDGVEFGSNGSTAK
jgi:hypothetical protein